MIARIHCEAARGHVGKDGSGKKIYTHFRTRRLLGFSKDFEQLAMEVAEELFNF